MSMSNRIVIASYIRCAVKLQQAILFQEVSVKNVRKIFVLASVLMLLFVAVVPAFAAPAELVVQNRTGSAVQLALKGPTDLTVNLSADGFRQRQTVKLEPGLYTYVYKACGLTKRGTMTVGETGNTPLILKKCPGEGETRISVSNRTGNPFTLSLTGKKSYSFWIAPGGSTVIVVAAGGYQYHTNACGVADSGQFKASARADQPIKWNFSCKPTNK